MIVLSLLFRLNSFVKAFILILLITISFSSLSFASNHPTDDGFSTMGGAIVNALCDSASNDQFESIVMNQAELQTKHMLVERLAPAGMQFLELYQYQANEVLVLRFSQELPGALTDHIIIIWQLFMDSLAHNYENLNMNVDEVRIIQWIAFDFPDQAYVVHLGSIFLYLEEKISLEEFNQQIFSTQK